MMINLRRIGQVLMDDFMVKDDWKKAEVEIENEVVVKRLERVRARKHKAR